MHFTYGDQQHLRAAESCRTSRILASPAVVVSGCPLLSANVVTPSLPRACQYMSLCPSCPMSLSQLAEASCNELQKMGAPKQVVLRDCAKPALTYLPARTMGES